MTHPPQMNRYVRHVLLCTGRHCDPDGQAEALYARLPHLLADLGRYENPCRVKRGTTPCLGVCRDGPLLVVYPDGIWYHHVDASLLERIGETHLREETPLWEQVFHRLEAGASDA